MCDHERLTSPVVVSQSAEIDIANAEHVREQLREAFAPDVTAVTPETGLTIFRAMNWLTNPEPEIGDCGRSNHARQIASPIIESAVLCRLIGR